MDDGRARHAAVRAPHAEARTPPVEGMPASRCGAHASRGRDARLTDEARAWQSRPLEAIYPIIYIDALFVSVREQGTVKKKAVYIALGTTIEGRRDVLGLWMDGSEGARFWLNALTELKIGASKTCSSSAVTGSRACRKPSRRPSREPLSKRASCI